MSKERAIDTRRLTAEIHSRLDAAGDPERRRVATTYYPTAMKVLGVSVPDLRVVVRDVSRRLKSESPDDVLSVVHALLAEGAFEGRQVAYELLWRQRPPWPR